MKFDNIIIGGGHSGLAKGMELLARGESVLAIAKGESSRRFRDEFFDHLKERKRFTDEGGVFFMGDTVVRGEIDKGILKAVYTANHGSSPLVAKRFWLSTGSFFSKGLESSADRVWEPIFGLDLNCEGDRKKRVNPDFFADQPFMHFGVLTDHEGHPSIGGKVISNLCAIGSITGR